MTERCQMAGRTGVKHTFPCTTPPAIKVADFASWKWKLQVVGFFFKQCFLPSTPSTEGIQVLTYLFHLFLFNVLLSFCCTTIAFLLKQVADEDAKETHDKEHRDKGIGNVFWVSIVVGG